MSITYFPDLLSRHRVSILGEWKQTQVAGAGLGAFTGEHVQEGEAFFTALEEGVGSGEFRDIRTAAWSSARGVLEQLSRSGAARGKSASETATFVFSFKAPIFHRLGIEFGSDPEKLAQEVWSATLLLDKLGLYIIEAFQKSREDVIRRQQEELLELSTPVIQLWKGILALPLIGTLDSSRTQVVMENLLQEIVNTEAEIAIIDITGVPTVDTLVAQHLLKTVAAARLMGADCIISGIRPQIAQTLVHLGVDLNVLSKASMAEAFAVALRRVGKAVVSRVAS